MPRDGNGGTGGREEYTAETADTGSETADPESDETPIRRGAVDVRTRDGASVHHDDAFVRHESDALVVSESLDFAPDETARYEKATLSWYEVRHPRS